MCSLKIIAHLLAYPTSSLWEARTEIFASIENLLDLSEDGQMQLGQFAQTFFAQDLMDAQEAYLEAFEQGRSASLYLFEHRYGESRERGQAMVELSTEYQLAGLTLDAKELPDYLPVYLEYLSTLEPDQQIEKLERIQPVLTSICAALTQKNKHYALLLGIVLSLAEKEDDFPILMDRVAPNLLSEGSFEVVDALWEETEIRFNQPVRCHPASKTSGTRPISFLSNH